MAGKPEIDIAKSQQEHYLREIREDLSKQGKGADTQVKIVILSCLVLALMTAAAPWFSMPILRYTNFSQQETLWNLHNLIDGVQYCITTAETLAMEPLSQEMTALLQQGILGLQIGAVVTIVLLIIAAFCAWKYKRKAVVIVRISNTAACFLSIAAFAASMYVNLMLNEALGRDSHFINLTVKSYMQMTAYPYAQFLISFVLLFGVRKLLDTSRVVSAEEFQTRTVKTDNKMGMRTKAAIAIILFAIPAVIFFGIYFLNDRSYYFIGLCIILLSMLPFFMVFESRRPQAREVLLIAVLAAIAVAGRAAFFMLPQFKPVTAIVIIAGVSFGAEAGFLTGAMAGFVSNFLFGQGPWTPWQMFAWGIIGFLAGLIFRGRRGKWKHKKWLVCTFGGLASLIVYGLIMDTASVIIYTSQLKWETLMAYYISGFPFNVVHGISTVFFLFVLAKPFISKLDRIKKKYGIMEP